VTRYRTIVADPPWPYDDKNAAWVQRDAGALMPYATMTLDEIAALPVKSLATNVDEDAHLYLWTTSRYLRDAFDIARAWGFHYVATLVWCKRPRGFNVGGVFQNNVEFCLFCRWPKVTSRADALKVTSRLADLAAAANLHRRQVDEHMGTSDMAGWWLSHIETRCAIPTDEQWTRLRALIPGAADLDADVARLNAAKGTTPPKPFEKATSRWYEWPRGEHSAKPEAFLDLVEQVSPGPYVELFARRDRLGWDTWGNESLGTAEMAA
jgi:N6-adenosine-specific RNA methylase IME4